MIEMQEDLLVTQMEGLKRGSVKEDVLTSKKHNKYLLLIMSGIHVAADALYVNPTSRNSKNHIY